MVSTLKAGASVALGVVKGTCAAVNEMLVGVGLFALPFGLIAQPEE